MARGDEGAQRVAELEPRLLWHYFAELARVPRCSTQEEAAMAWIESVAAAHGIAARRDATGNRMVPVPATPGCELAPTVVLQSHVDMVCEKDPEVIHDFARDAIRPRIAGDWVTATGTTLGADDGIGVAAALAFLDDRTAVHGPLELLFTVDEESGLTGARGLDPALFTGRILLNLDADQVGRFTVGSAGGQDTHLRLAAERAAWPAGIYYQLEVGGLKGGHSGVDIDKNRGNAIKILGRVLLSGAEALGSGAAANAAGGVRIGSAWGGSKRNAIPRQAAAVVAVPAAARAVFEQAVRTQAALIGAELRDTDSGLAITLEPLAGEALAAARANGVIPSAAAGTLLRLITALPSGVLAMSTRFAKLVDTSSNVGVLVDEGDAHTLICATRSARSAALEGAIAQIRAGGHLAGAQVTHSDGYGPWEADPESPLRRIVAEVYRRLFVAEPAFEAVHGGLECGLFVEKRPELDMIAYGAEMLDAHSPSERVNIASVLRFWNFTRGLLEELTRGTVTPAALPPAR
jgi:dipeptidase D